MIDKALYKNKKTKPVKQAGVMNYLGKQEMVTAPKFWLSEPDHVKAKLAYITDEEEKILIDKNLYGSLKGKPNKGPAGLPSLQGGDFGAGGGGGNTGGGNGGSSNRERGITSRGKGPKGTTGNIGSTNRERGIEKSQRQLSTIAQKGTLSDPNEKKDFFTQSYVGPSLFGTGYRDTVMPNTTAYGNKSRLGSAILGGIGLLSGIPGLGLLANKVTELGPFNNQAFFDTKVTPAGKFTGTGFQDYMNQRMSGKIDAYGNPIGTTGGGQADRNQIGIMGVQEVIPSKTQKDENPINKDPIQLSKTLSLNDMLDFNYGTFSNPVMYSDL